MKSVTLWTRRDPFAEFDALVRAAFGPSRAWPTARARAFRSGFTPAIAAAAFTAPWSRSAFAPAAEVVRDGQDALVRVELPGVDFSNDVTVEVDRGNLVVRGERRDERAEDTDGRSVREVRYGSFRRSFALPQHVTAEDVTASYEAGVLTVRVAGAYTDSPAQRIAVTAGAPAAIEAAPEGAATAEAAPPESAVEPDATK